MEPAVTAIASYMVFILIASILDGFWGGRGFMGRFLGPDRIAYNVANYFSKKLNKKDRSINTLKFRGFVATFLLMCAAGLVGALIDNIAFRTSFLTNITSQTTAEQSLAGQITATVLLSLIMGQRAVLELVLHVTKLLQDPDLKEEKHRYGAARWSVERLILRLSDGIIANLFLILLGLYSGIGGFAALFAFRILSVTIASGAPSGVEGPISPYYTYPRYGFTLITYIPAKITGLLLAVAALFTPTGTLHGFKAILNPRPKNYSYRLLRARAVPMAVMAHAFNLSFKINPDTNNLDNWLGPKDGKARLGPEDLKKIIHTSLIMIMLVGLLVSLIALIDLGAFATNAEIFGIQLNF